MAFCSGSCRLSGELVLSAFIQALRSIRRPSVCTPFPAAIYLKDPVTGDNDFSAALCDALQAVMLLHPLHGRRHLRGPSAPEPILLHCLACGRTLSSSNPAASENQLSSSAAETTSAFSTSQAQRGADPPSRNSGEPLMLEALAKASSEQSLSPLGGQLSYGTESSIRHTFAAHSLSTSALDSTSEPSTVLPEGAASPGSLQSTGLPRAYRLLQWLLAGRRTVEFAANPFAGCQRRPALGGLLARVHPLAARVLGHPENAPQHCFSVRVRVPEGDEYWATVLHSSGAGSSSSAGCTLRAVGQQTIEAFETVEQSHLVKGEHLREPGKDSGQSTEGSSSPRGTSCQGTDHRCSFMAFHGTSSENLHSILRCGLLSFTGTQLQQNGGLHGAGIYLSTDPAVALAFCKAGDTMASLPGTAALREAVVGFGTECGLPLSLSPQHWCEQALEEYSEFGHSPVFLLACQVYYQKGVLRGPLAAQQAPACTVCGKKLSSASELASSSAAQWQEAFSARGGENSAGQKEDMGSYVLVDNPSLVAVRCILVYGKRSSSNSVKGPSGIAAASLTEARMSTEQPRQGTPVQNVPQETVTQPRHMQLPRAVQRPQSACNLVLMAYVFVLLAIGLRHSPWASLWSDWLESWRFPRGSEDDFF